MKYMYDIPKWADVMTVGDFLEAIRGNAFVDYDGYGNPVRQGRLMRKTIVPSKVNEIPSDATHIAWYNR